MTLTPTNLTLMFLTLAAGAATVVAWVGLGRLATGRPGEEADPPRPMGGWPNLAVVLIAAAAAVLLAWRWVGGGGWSPLASHLDGLLLIVGLLAVVALFLQTRPRLGGLAAFTLPVLTFLLAWAICAATWTDRPFLVDRLHPVWRAIHLAGVYLGTLGSIVAAVAAACYLFVERRLKQKRDPRGLMRLASLERLEGIVVHASALGFALLSAGIVAGVVVLRDEPDALGPGWWYSPKVLLAFGAWCIFALVMNVRFATAFRGRRAAWLAIGGLVLLLAVYGIVTAGNGHGNEADPGPSELTAAPAAGEAR